MFLTLRLKRLNIWYWVCTTLSHYSISLNLINCKSQMCNTHILSTLFSKFLCHVPCHTVCSFIVFPTRVTNSLDNASVFLLFISFHPSVLLCLIGHQQDKKKKEKVMHACGNSITIRLLLNSSFPTASLHHMLPISNVGSLCHHHVYRS